MEAQGGAVTTKIQAVDGTSKASRVQRPFLDLQGWLLRQRFFTSKVLPAMPRRLRWALRCVYFAPVDLIERFRPCHIAMVPPYRQRFTGYSGDDFVESGQCLVNVLANTADLTARSNVLDIGSGIGCLAIPLTRLITSPGSYDGLDIVERGVRWCTTNITPMHPHFRFTHADVFNAEYNPGGTVKAAEYELPYGDSSFDIVCLFSVFTHMLIADVEHYLAEISRVLRPGGRLAATFLVLNEESVKSMQAGKGIYNFTYHEGPQWFLKDGMLARELAVGYEEDYVRSLYSRNGLDVSGFYVGSWSGLPGAPEVRSLGQDLVVGSKRQS
jgi:SAM-dependent methyltransferase